MIPREWIAPCQPIANPLRYGFDIGIVARSRKTNNLPSSDDRGGHPLLIILGSRMDCVCDRGMEKHKNIRRVALLYRWRAASSSEYSIAPLRENMAEHRAHQLGLFFCLFLCGFQATKKHLLYLCLLVLLSYATHKRNIVWQSEVGLWKEG